MKIERVLKKNQQSVLIYFDDSTKLSVSLEVFLKSGLKKSDEISGNRFSVLKDDEKKFKIMQRALRLLGRRQHSVFELKQKLLQKAFEPVIVNDVLKELQENNYLDDRKFASSFIEEKLQSKSWGPKKVIAELWKKGIERSIISETLKTMTDDNDSIQKAEELTVKKLKSLKKKNYDVKTLRNKISAYLLARGYEYDLIRDVCNKILGEDYQAE